MPWNANPSIQLQDMYDQVYSHLISTSQHCNTVLQVLGQIIIAKDMLHSLGATGISTNSSSPNRIASILGLEHKLVMQLVTDFHLLLEGGDKDSDIMIRHPSFLEFLLDSSRSQELCIDVDYALLILQPAPLRIILDSEGM